MKILFRYLSIFVVVGLLILALDMRSWGRDPSVNHYVTWLVAYVLLLSPLIGRWAEEWGGKGWKWFTGLLTIGSFVGVLGYLYMHQKNDWSVNRNGHDFWGEFLPNIFLLGVVSLVILLLSFIPFKKLLAGEAWSEALEFVYGGLKLGLLGLVIVEMLFSVVHVMVTWNGFKEFLIGMVVIAVYFIPMLLLPLLVLHPTVARIRQRRGLRVLMHVRRALKAQLPMIHVLESASRSEYGKLADRLKSMSVQIGQGLSVSDSLALSVPEIEVQQIRLLQASDRLGYLPSAIDRQIDHQMALQSVRHAQGSPGWRYLLLNLVVGSFLLSAIMVFIVPKFEKIFEDFDTELPAMTTALMNGSRWMAGSLPGQFLPGILWILPVFVGVLVLWYARRREHGIGRISQALAWYLPVLRLVHRPEQLAKASHQIADGLEAALPLDKSVALTRDCVGHFAVKPMLKRFEYELSQGSDITVAATRARFPRAFTLMLNGPTQQQHLPQTLRYLADYYAAVAQQRAVWLGAITAPLVITLIGVPVGWICIGLFSPLVKLIQNLAEGSGMF